MVSHPKKTSLNDEVQRFFRYTLRVCSQAGKRGEGTVRIFWRFHIPECVTRANVVGGVEAEIGTNGGGGESEIPEEIKLE